MGPIYLFMERSFEPPAWFEQVEPERGGRLCSQRVASRVRHTDDQHPCARLAGELWIPLDSIKLVHFLHEGWQPFSRQV